MPTQTLDNTKMFKNMFAASTCISIACSLFNPLDTYRIRWQVQSHHPSITAHLTSVLRSEGLVRGLWLPGIGSNAIGAGLSRGIGMGCYPTLRDSIASEKSGGTMFLAGLLSGGLGYFVSTPAWVVKTRLQAGMENKANPPKGNGLLIFREIVHQQGMKGLYRGASALVVRGALINAGNTLGYDLTKTTNKQHHIVPEGPLLHVLASVVAAFLSSTFSVPADFVMTRYQAGPQMGHHYVSVVDCASTLLREEGPTAFFRGWTPLFVRVAPLYICYLPVYEQVRKMLGLGYLD